MTVECTSTTLTRCLSIFFCYDGEFFVFVVCSLSELMRFNFWAALTSRALWFMRVRKGACILTGVLTGRTDSGGGNPNLSREGCLRQGKTMMQNKTKIDRNGDLIFHSYTISAKELARDEPLKLGRYCY